MNILITGGTGLVGKKLSTILTGKGHEVRVLSRSKRKNTDIKYFQWDLEAGSIDKNALLNVDCLVHLVGAGIVDEKWTDQRKKLIIDSRVDPLLLLAKEFKAINEKPKAIISASAIGIYGFGRGEEKVSEDSEFGEDYLAEVTKLWENAVVDFAKKLKIREARIRIGIVMDKGEGALPKLALPVKFGVGSALGDGKQWTSWIHANDLAQLFVEAIEREAYSGAYNAVAPNPVRNSEFVNIVAKVLKMPIWAPNVPAFVLRMLLGERARLVLEGTYVKNERLQEQGFQFQFTDLEAAVQDIYKS